MHLKNKIDSARVRAAIEAAEARSSGEIVVSIAEYFIGNVPRAARETLERLGVTKTRLRNGVLLFVAPARRRFEILADDGIHAKVAPGFWEMVAAALGRRFAAREYTDGLVEAIERIGTELALHFPRGPHDINELSDEPDAGVRHH